MKAVVHSILVWFSFVTATHAGESESPIATPKFMGAQSCASSSCHGGAGELSKQFTVWSQYDFHHQRPYATLTTARSERLAEVLKIGRATESPRCTVCHAPFQTVPPERLAKEAKVTEGVSCESCHGPAENWLLSHTRKDYTHADRVHAGMRDLKNIYVRANTCVACHQNVDPDILAAGHPELISELDGQCVTMPKHWREQTNWSGAQTWLVGQAVALREMSWQLAAEKDPPPDAIDRWAGLLWIAGKARDAIDGKPTSPPFSFGPDKFTIPSMQQRSDAQARAAADREWTGEMTSKTLLELANSSVEFTDERIPIRLRARMAERLVLALDRLTIALAGAKTDAVNAALDRLFADVQSIPDFDPNQFAKDLKEFKSCVSGVLESK